MVKTSPSNAGVTGSIPGWGDKIPRASRPKTQNKKQKQSCIKFNRTLKIKKSLIIYMMAYLCTNYLWKETKTAILVASRNGK